MDVKYLAAGLLLAVAACAPTGAAPAATDGEGVPQEFAEACGKPGSMVMTERTRVVIKHADCDLTGVVIANQGGGATVPGRGEGVAGASSSGTVTIQVDGATGDVTFTGRPVGRRRP